MSAFAIERHPVTNAQFETFVADTGYVTTAERVPDPRRYPGADSAALVPGGLVFTPTAGPVPLEPVEPLVAMGVWCDVAFTTRPWKLSGRQGRSSVVMVAYNDALAYAQWAGRRLPTEAKFEYAARGGVPNSTYARGAEVRPDGRLMANTWQARFPYLNTGADGWIGTSPVGAFPVNNWGLADMIGNVREWTSTYYAVGDDRARADELSLQDGARRGDAAVAPTTCCAATTGLALSVANSTESTVARRSAAPEDVLPRRVLKGGPHLCASEYCLRYRPATRSPQSIESATTHVGFRCAATVAA